MSWLFKLDNKRKNKSIEVDFNPVKAINQDRGNQVMSFSITPRFNTDRKFYTPAFFNPYEGL